MERLMRRRGFSDKLYWLNFKAVWLFTVACFLLTAVSGSKLLDISDLAIVTYGIPSAFAELGIHTGFIVWKAKAENCRKHKDKNTEELEEIDL